jgi:hypothetical protein
MWKAWLIKVLGIEDNSEYIQELRDTINALDGKVTLLSMDNASLSADVEYYKGKVASMSAFEERINLYKFVFSDGQSLSNTRALSIIKDTTGASTIMLADHSFSTVAFDEFVEWLYIFRQATLGKEYSVDKFDCDDFSKHLVGAMSTQENANNAVMELWSTLHAFNAFVDNSYKLWYVEPMNGSIIDPKMKDLPEAYRNVYFAKM